jgi:hypothetical protein
MGNGFMIPDCRPGRGRRQRSLRRNALSEARCAWPNSNRVYWKKLGFRGRHAAVVRKFAYVYAIMGTQEHLSYGNRKKQRQNRRDAQGQRYE